MNIRQEKTAEAKNQANAASILPKDTIGDIAGSLKIAMAVTGIADFVIGIISNKKDSRVYQENTSGTTKSDVIECVSLGLSLTDFALSYAIGYHMYSPMDSTSDEEYNKKCAVAQNACSVYTYLWWAKTATASLSSITKIWGRKIFHDSAGYVQKGIDVIYLAECFISGFAELIAFIEASIVTASVDGEYKTDGGCFISDTLGFAFNDIKSILDFCIGQAENASLPLIISREAFCGLYVTSQISTGTVILVNK